MTWLIDTAFATGGLIALVLVLRGPVARQFGPGMAYALWALPLLRLVMPPLVLPAESAPATETITVLDVAAASPLAATPPAPAWSLFAPVLQAVWLAGALAFLGWRAWSYVVMRRSLLKNARPVGQVGDVRLVESSAIAAPLAFGLAEKVVALPWGFMDRQDRAGRDLAIAHELEHHAGRDLAVNMAMQPLLALHWFNPLAWLAWRALRRDQEAACDARVLAGRDLRVRAAYAGLIASFAQSPRMALAAPMACPVLGEKSIVHRLRSLTMTEPTGRSRVLGRLLLGVAALALPLTATISHATPEAPTPPAAPEAPAAPLPPEAPVAPDAPTPPDAPDSPDALRHEVVVMQHGDHAPGKPGEEEQVVIVDRQGAKDGKLVTRSVSRGGRTVVFHTARPLSDAEVEARIAALDQAMTADAEAVAISHDGESPRIERRVVMMHPDGTGMAAMDGKHCQESVTNSETGGNRQVVRVRVCGKEAAEARSMTLKALRQARAEIASNAEIPAEARANALKEIDGEIAKLAK